MRNVPVQEAQDHLGELILEAAQGEAVIITHQTGVSVQLSPVAPGRPRPRFGSARGKIKIAEDFNAPLDDFEAYAP